jgi:probable molybdopterin binding protein
VRVERVAPGRRAPASLVGAVLTRDLTVAGQRWEKGRRLSADDLRALAAEEAGPPVSVVVAERGELHEDDAALRLAKAIAGPNLEVRGPNQSRLDLVAATPGVVSIRIAELERINRLDPLEVFTVYDGQIVERGDLVASVKVAPHLVDATVVEAGSRIAGFGRQPIVWVASFAERRVGVVVKQSVRATARERFEASVRAKVESLGSRILDIVYVEDDLDAVETAVGRFVRGADTADLVLTAGSASTDPQDAFFVAIEALGGRIVRRGVPSHPGSMLWLARVGGTAILGLPTCGAYSKATAVDLLLPRLLSGEPASEATVAKLGHGGILTRSQRYRFPRYARELEDPEG